MREKMRKFLVLTMKTDQIDRVNLDELKQVTEGEGMISRIKYRRQVNNMMTGRKQKIIAKGEILKLEHAHAENLDEKEKNETFGFTCLHYSVSEASGTIKIVVINKKNQAGQVRVTTIDGDAIAGDDYEKVDTVLDFAKGDTEKFIEVKINDDDNWEPDEDFFVQLYDASSGQELAGKDTRTRVTIIDDDKPGQLCF